MVDVMVKAFGIIYTPHQWQYSDKHWAQSFRSLKFANFKIGLSTPQVLLE